MTPEQLQSSLGTLDGFKRIMKPFLIFFGGPKKSFEVYQASSKKGVYTNHTLAKFTHDGDFYYIFGFSTNGELSPDELSRLRAAAEEVELGTVRYESLSYTGLEPWRGEVGSAADEKEKITSIGDPSKGLFVYPVAAGSNEHDRYPLVIHAVKDGQDCIYPVKNP